MAHSDYQDTVAKMARKYSQYRLPNMAEVAESDEDDNFKIEGPSDNYTTSNTAANANVHGQTDIDEPGQINDPSFSQQNINAMSAQQSFPNEQPSVGIISDEEEDEDLLSEATFISHKSFDNNSFIHKPSTLIKTRTTSKGSMSSAKSKRVQFASSAVNVVNPIEEIREIQMGKQLLTEIFDKYFDEEKQQDVDYEEFKRGLNKLEVDIKEEQMQKLWNVLLMSGDNEENGYLDRDQFTDFLTRRFEAPQLVAFQVCT